MYVGTCTVHEFGQTLGEGEGQRSLVCCSPWGRRVGHDLETEQQCTSARFQRKIYKASEDMYRMNKLDNWIEKSGAHSMCKKAPGQWF